MITATLENTPRPKERSEVIRGVGALFWTPAVRVFSCAVRLWRFGVTKNQPPRFCSLTREPRGGLGSPSAEASLPSAPARTIKAQHAASSWVIRRSNQVTLGSLRQGNRSHLHDPAVPRRDGCSSTPRSSGATQDNGLMQYSVGVLLPPPSPVR